MQVHILVIEGNHPLGGLFRGSYVVPTLCC